MFEYLELYVYVDIIIDNYDLFLLLKINFWYVFCICSLKFVLWVDKDVFKFDFIVNYIVFYKIKIIVINYFFR